MNVLRCAVAAALGLTLSVSTYSAASAQVAKPRAVYAVGDSITFGIGTNDPATQAYPMRVAAHIPDVHSVGHPGQCLVANICDYPPLVDTFRAEVLDATPKPSEIIIEIGVNDLDRSSMSDYHLRRNYLHIVRMARAAGAIVHVATITPHGNETPYSYEAQRERINRWIRWRWPRRHIDFAAALEAPDGSLLPEFDSGDGLHPNAQGARVMARVVVRALRAG